MPEVDLFTEKRIHPRIPIKLPVKYRAIEEQDVLTTARDRKSKDQNSYTVNVSLGGLYLVTDHIPDLESFLRLEISIPEIHRMITAFTEVVWSNFTGAGLHFEAIKEEDLEVLYNFLLQKSLNYKTQ